MRVGLQCGSKMGAMLGVLCIASALLWSSATKAETHGHLEKFLSPSRHESDSVTARGHGRMERAGHGAEELFRCCAQAGGDQRSGRSAGNDQEDRAMGGFPY